MILKGLFSKTVELFPVYCFLFITWYIPKIIKNSRLSDYKQALSLERFHNMGCGRLQ